LSIFINRSGFFVDSDTRLTSGKRLNMLARCKFTALLAACPWSELDYRPRVVAPGQQGYFINTAS
jgi:hypothetical protein